MLGDLTPCASQLRLALAVELLSLLASASHSPCTPVPSSLYSAQEQGQQQCQQQPDHALCSRWSSSTLSSMHSAHAHRSRSPGVMSSPKTFAFARGGGAAVYPLSQVALCEAEADGEHCCFEGEWEGQRQRREEADSGGCVGYLSCTGAGSRVACAYAYVWRQHPVPAVVVFLVRLLFLRLAQWKREQRLGGTATPTAGASAAGGARG
ncbi:hypothetical protein DFH08DRAFT_976101 [Mycena albidolilacea]|uniref:Uncharacterized protein n=1 Tax=Mycena albidolilacea TaxID=1033008 RepID=A0AAD7E9V8_9AGAR|nr:hypothetical protein DFH08DRAFT_976101 [Mycena albidolilacea]